MLAPPHPSDMATDTGAAILAGGTTAATMASPYVGVGTVLGAEAAAQSAAKRLKRPRKSSSKKRTKLDYR